VETERNWAEIRRVRIRVMSDRGEARQGRRQKEKEKDEWGSDGVAFQPQLRVELRDVLGGEESESYDCGESDLDLDGGPLSCHIAASVEP
jgi:hypothetical protein